MLSHSYINTSFAYSLIPFEEPKVGESKTTMSSTEKMHSSGLNFREYVDALEIEKQKIQVFQRELPLCLDLVIQTIERCKQQLSSGAAVTTEYLHGHQSECTSEHVTSSGEEHVFEEFMPMKRSSSENSHDVNKNDEDGEEEESGADKSTETNNDDDSMVVDVKKKSEWLRSVQLWNGPSPDPPPKEKEDLAKKGSAATEVKRNGGAFQPFQREKSCGKNDVVSSPDAAATPVPAPATSSSGGGKKEEQRKQRRNWSPELHKRFLNALQQLGGSHAATPKQIRELMKVDGLTNDEVKSHLQKYRLHTRRPSQAIPANGNAQTPQVVFVGGIWMQPSEYSPAPADSSGGGGIYAPVAAPAVRRTEALTWQTAEKAERSNSEERVSHVSESGVHHSNSPATSSSTHTTTTSPAC